MQINGCFWPLAKEEGDCKGAQEVFEDDGNILYLNLDGGPWIYTNVKTQNFTLEIDAVNVHVIPQ